MMHYINFCPNRTYCDTLEDMRRVLKHIQPLAFEDSVKILESLVEECQVHGNRMEAGLNDKHDMVEWHAERKRLKKEIEKLRMLKEELEDD